MFNSRRSYLDALVASVRARRTGSAGLILSDDGFTNFYGSTPLFGNSKSNPQRPLPTSLWPAPGEKVGSVDADAIASLRFNELGLALPRFRRAGRRPCIAIASAGETIADARKSSNP